MELLQLRYFYDSTKTGSFAKTAEKFMVPASSVSASVKRLEKELGCQLFDRSCNRIILNANGKQLQQTLDIVFKELDSAVNSLSNATNDTREIQLLVQAMRNRIIPFIIDYRTRHPQVVIKMVFDYEETQYDKYDIIIGEENNQNPDYDKFVLFNTEVRIDASINSPLCNQSLTLKQLYNQPFITLGEQSSMHKILVRACSQAGFSPNIIITTNDIQCYKTYIKSGMVLGLLRHDVNTPKDPTALLQALDVKDFNERQRICCYYKRQEAYGSMKHFLDFLKSQVM